MRTASWGTYKYHDNGGEFAYFDITFMKTARLAQMRVDNKMCFISLYKFVQNIFRFSTNICRVTFEIRTETPVDLRAKWLLLLLAVLDG